MYTVKQKLLIQYRQKLAKNQDLQAQVQTVQQKISRLENAQAFALMSQIERKLLKLQAQEESLKGILGALSSVQQALTPEQTTQDPAQPNTQQEPLENPVHEEPRDEHYDFPASLEPVIQVLGYAKELQPLALQLTEPQRRRF